MTHGGQRRGPSADPGRSHDEPARPPGPYRLPASARIRSGTEIRRIMRRGKRERTDHLDVFLASSPVSHSRFGTVVPKHGHEIVERNRLRRRLREVGRCRVLPQLREEGRAVDVLVLARRRAYEADFATLRDELTRGVSRWLERS